MTLSLTATTRTIIGKRVKQLRTAGTLPLVVYGRTKAARSIQAPTKTFRGIYDDAGRTTLVDLAIDDAAPIKVLIHEVELDPLTGTPLHADLYQVDLKQKITAEIPLVVTGEAPAVKELDGALLVNQDYVAVEALPQDLPKEILVDVSRLATFDDAITAGSLALPAGVTLVTDAEVDLIFVQPPREEEPEEVVVSAEDAEKQAIEGMEAEAAAEKAEKESAEGEPKEA